MPPSTKRRRRGGDTERKTRFHVFLTETQLVKAEEAAQRERRSLAEMLRILIDEGLVTYEIKRR